jgi:hypothetical protein
MIIPTAMNIYSAKEELKKMDPRWRDDQLKELCSAIPAATDDMAAGYELGLAVARVVLMGEPPIYQAGLKPEDLL